MPLMTRAQASPFRTTTVQLILITSINAGRFNLRECVGAATRRHVSLPLPSPSYSRITVLAASRNENIRIRRVYSSISSSSLFFRTFTYSRGFIASLDLYRKLNGEMKNRGTGREKLRVLNREKCDEITFRNIRVTEKYFFHLLYIFSFFFFERSRMTLAYVHVRSYRTY